MLETSERHPPVSALVLSIAACAIPVMGALRMPDLLEDYQALLWLIALVPAFLLAYYRGWRGAATAAAGGMAIVSLTYATTQTMGRPVPELLPAVVFFFIAIALGAGALAERLHPPRVAGPKKAGFTDAATGLPNRAHAELHLDIEFSAAKRGRPLAIVLLDFNKFEGFNARQGTITGEHVLRTVGDVLKHTTRRMNLSARFGDDSFLCILGGCDDEGAIVFVNRLQEDLARAAGPGALPSISAGIASFRPSMRSLHDLLGAAESALKQSRKDGRGRVRVFGHSTSMPLALGESALARVDAAPVATVMPQGRGYGRKALIVAEDAPVRALLARLMTDYGFTVAQVSNVVDGVQCLTLEYDLLFTDISLSEGFGAELVRAAKVRWPSIQVLGIIVQEHEGELLIETLNAGVDRYLVAPLDLAKVRQHITELLARRDLLATSVLESRQLALEFKARTNDALSDKRILEDQLRQSQKVEAIGRLAGGLAHDFNNLLTVIRGNAQLLDEELPNTIAREFLQQIDQAASRGAALVKQMLAFGRKQLLQPSLVSLNTVIEGTHSMLSRLIGENIILEIDLEPALGFTKADPNHIEQILFNLAVNSREAMKNGGHIRISTRNAVLAAHSSDNAEEDVVVMTVSDDGIGMDEETQEHIFEPFFTTKSGAHASGLGLATVYGIVRQSGGTISVSSQVGRGTTFEIAFPRVNA